MTVRYRDRKEAGEALARHLAHLDRAKDTIILALPRGGVPVAAEVAQALHLPLDVLLVRKLGVPGQEELAMGAIADGDVCYLNQGLITTLGLSDADIESVRRREEKELHRRSRLYRGDMAPLNPENKTVLIIDDGLATGATMRAAIKSLEKRQPEKIIVAVPVGAADTCQSLYEEADEIICPLQPENFYGVGHWYENFSQTQDEDVVELLRNQETMQNSNFTVRK